MSVYSRNIYIKKWSSENRRMVITIQAGKLTQAAHRNNRAMMKLVRIKICKLISTVTNSWQTLAGFIFYLPLPWMFRIYCPNTSGFYCFVAPINLNLIFNALFLRGPESYIILELLAPLAPSV